MLVPLNGCYRCQYIFMFVELHQSGPTMRVVVRTWTELIVMKYRIAARKKTGLLARVNA